VTQVSVSLGARAGRWRAAALLVALAAHFLFIAILAWQARPWTDEERGPAPVIELQVAPRLTPRTVSPPHPAHPLGPSATRPYPVERSTEPQTPAAPAPPSPERPAETPSSPSEAAGGDARQALRAAFGCGFAALANLTADERQHCQDRLTQGRRGERPQEFAVVAPATRAIFEANAKRALWWQQPFLATTPKNGCAPKVTNQQSAVPGGHAMSDWRAGISCGHAF